MSGKMVFQEAKIDKFGSEEAKVKTLQQTKDF